MCTLSLKGFFHKLIQELSYNQDIPNMPYLPLSVMCSLTFNLLSHDFCAFMCKLEVDVHGHIL